VCLVLRDAADADEILHVLAVLKAQTHTPKSEVKRSNRRRRHTAVGCVRSQPAVVDVQIYRRQCMRCCRLHACRATAGLHQYSYSPAAAVARSIAESVNRYSAIYSMRWTALRPAVAAHWCAVRTTEWPHTVGCITDAAAHGHLTHACPSLSALSRLYGSATVPSLLC
jgi:hypothetical protein